jgi:hypothetical protein
MAYRANPFLERMSERTTSDQEFVQMFAPKVLERLNDDCLRGEYTFFAARPEAERRRYCEHSPPMRYALSGTAAPWVPIPIVS